MPTSVGIAGGVPARSSRWQDAQCCRYSARAVLAGRHRGQRAGPRNVVRVDVQDPGLGIDGRAAPLRAPVVARKDQRVLTDRERHERAVAELAELRRPPTLCASGVRVVSMSSVSSCRANGFGLVGSGCVSAAVSPGTSLAGYFRYSIGNSGVPFVRSNTNTKPCLVVCTTASIDAAVLPEPDEARRRRQIAIPDDRAARPGSARCAARSPRSSASRRIGEEVVARAVRRRRNRRPPIRSARRRSRVPRRAPCRPSCWPRRCGSTTPSPTSRSRSRRDAESCETSSARRRSSRRRPGRGPATTAALRRRGRRR